MANRFKNRFSASLWQVLVGFFLSFYLGRAESAPITFNTALPVSQEQIIVREQFVYQRTSDDIDNLIASTVFGYGLNEKWSLFAELPLVNLDINGQNRRFGIGDISLFTRREIFRSDNQGTTARLAPLLGIRLPSGREGETGDGSVDLFVGLIATIATTKYNFGGQITYTQNNEANGLETGDSLSLQTSLQYRVWPKKLSAQTRGFLFAVLENNLSYQRDSQIGGLSQAGTGGTLVSVSPGLQYVTQRWIADLAFTVPIRDGSPNLAPDISVLTSIRLNF